MSPRPGSKPITSQQVSQNKGILLVVALPLIKVFELLFKLLYFVVCFLTVDLYHYCRRSLERPISENQRYLKLASPSGCGGGKRILIEVFSLSVLVGMVD